MSRKLTDEDITKAIQDIFKTNEMAFQELVKQINTLAKKVDELTTKLEKQND